MIYFFFGTDIEKARVKANELIDSLRKKKVDAGFFKLDAENFNSSIIQEYIGGQGLFSNKYVVFLDRLCENKEVKGIFLDYLKEIAESENIFIILEGKIDKATATKIEKKAEKSIRLDIVEKESSELSGGNNAFALANAFGRRNKKESWMLYREAINKGEAPEALHGMIFWKVKTLFISGDNTYWKNEELVDVLHRLVAIYHDSRRGIHELETGLEAFLLS